MGIKSKAQGDSKDGNVVVGIHGIQLTCETESASIKSNEQSAGTWDNDNTNCKNGWDGSGLRRTVGDVSQKFFVNLEGGFSVLPKPCRLQYCDYAAQIDLLVMFYCTFRFSGTF